MFMMFPVCLRLSRQTFKNVSLRELVRPCAVLPYNKEARNKTVPAAKSRDTLNDLAFREECVLKHGDNRGTVEILFERFQHGSSSPHVVKKQGYPYVL